MVTNWSVSSKGEKKAQSGREGSIKRKRIKRLKITTARLVFILVWHLDIGWIDNGDWSWQFYNVCFSISGTSQGVFVLIIHHHYFLVRDINPILCPAVDCWGIFNRTPSRWILGYSCPAPTGHPTKIVASPSVLHNVRRFVVSAREYVYPSGNRFYYQHGWPIATWACWFNCELCQPHSFFVGSPHCTFDPTEEHQA